MRKYNKSRVLCLFLLTLPLYLSANELHTETWEFPTHEDLLVRQNQLLINCQAGTFRCPAGLSKSTHNGGSSGLYTPTSSSTANNTSVIITGSGNSMTLSTEQSSENDSLQSDNSGEATIENTDILNLGQ
jgi:hypothetical protein